MVKKISLTHPGEMLLEDFLQPLSITPYRLAKDINVPATRISEIIRGKRSISADTALRLERYFGVSAKFWLNFQAHYDLEFAKRRLEKKIKVEVKILNQKVPKPKAP